MERYEIASLAQGVVWVVGGAPVPQLGRGALVSVYERGTSSPVTIYASQTGAQTLSQPLVANQAGEVPGWIEGAQVVDVLVVVEGRESERHVIDVGGFAATAEERQRAEAAEALQGPPFTTGQGLWHASPFYLYVATPALRIGAAYAGPFFLCRACVLQSMACLIRAVGGSGSLLRFGIYADTGSGYPGALIKDFGTVLATAHGATATTSSEQALARGWYWGALVAQGAAETEPPVVEGSEGPTGLPMQAKSAAEVLEDWGTAYKAEGVMGPLPATWPPTRVVSPWTPLLAYQIA